jgi:hypothetical protein
MVATQIAAHGVTDPAGLAAMRTVPHEAFVRPELAEFAYDGMDGTRVSWCSTPTFRQPSGPHTTTFLRRRLAKWAGEMTTFTEPQYPHSVWRSRRRSRRGGMQVALPSASRRVTRLDAMQAYTP